jgi:hypothetical protein
MKLPELVQQLWENFVLLFKKSEEEPPAIFSRIKEAGDWRSGSGLWSGVLPLFSTRIYYLEITRTSYADKRELPVNPKPTHTFKLYYFTQVQSSKERITVFVYHKNCYLQGSSEDYIAIEILGRAIQNRLQILCDRSSVGSPDIIKTETITKPGQLPQIRLKNEHRGIPASLLIGRASTQTQTNWQEFIDKEMQRLFDERTERARKLGMR